MAASQERRRGCKVAMAMLLPCPSHRSQPPQGDLSLTPPPPQVAAAVSVFGEFSQLRIGRDKHTTEFRGFAHVRPPPRTALTDVVTDVVREPAGHH